MLGWGCEMLAVHAQVVAAEYPLFVKYQTLHHHQAPEQVSLCTGRLYCSRASSILHGLPLFSGVASARISLAMFSLFGENQ